MVEINNQRKAFLDMLAWSEGTDVRRQKTRNHGYDVIVGGERSLLITPITLANLSRWAQNSNQQAPDATSFSCWWDAYRKQLGLKDFSEKSGRCGIAADIYSVALYL